MDRGRKGSWCWVRGGGEEEEDVVFGAWYDHVGIGTVVGSHGRRFLVERHVQVMSCSAKADRFRLPECDEASLVEVSGEI